jgi:hypothetical protein
LLLVLRPAPSGDTFLACRVSSRTSNSPAARLVAALKAAPVVKAPEVGGEPHPEPVVWSTAATRMIDGGAR